METILSYKVSLGYNTFYFDDQEEAIGFARTAKLHYRDKHDKKDEIEVNIEIEIAELPFVKPEEVKEEE